MRDLGFECKVDGCDRNAQYKNDKVCQKHYFRMIRYGTYELTRAGKAKKKYITDNGYYKVYRPDHVLSDNTGYIFEHRFFLFEEIWFGNHKCDICGKYWNWRGKKDHVDHIDENKLNNDLTNLRPLCNACNSNRNKKPHHKCKNNHSLTYKGETKTPQEWSRLECVKVHAATILRRMRSGYSPQECLYMEKKTHNGREK